LTIKRFGRRCYAPPIEVKREFAVQRDRHAALTRQGTHGAIA